MSFALPTPHPDWRFVSVAGALLLAWTIPVSAQPNTPSANLTPQSARAAVEQFWAAAWTRSSIRVADLIDPEAIASFQRQQIVTLAGFAEMDARRQARGDAQGAAMEAFGLDELPRRLTEAQRSFPVRGIPGVERLGELEALTPTEFFARLMGAWASVRWDEGARRDAPPDPPTVLGEVAEGDSLAHVVYRSLYTLDPSRAAQQRELALPSVQVMTARRSGNRWCVVPDHFVFFWLAPPWMPTLEGPPGNR